MSAKKKGKAKILKRVVFKYNDGTIKELTDRPQEWLDDINISKMDKSQITPYHLHPHSNPAITTGSMAVYREPKPEEIDENQYSDIQSYNVDANHFQKIIKKHESSLLAYIKEPGFKDKDIVFDIKTGQKYRIDKEGMMDDKVWVLNMTGSIGGIMLNKEQLNKFYSHYQEGQQIDPGDFKYVRKKIKPKTKFSGLNPLGREGYNYKWQEVKEPIMRIDFIIDPKYTQFQTSCRKGTILLTPIHP